MYSTDRNTVDFPYSPLMTFQPYESLKQPFKRVRWFYGLNKNMNKAERCAYESLAGHFFIHVCPYPLSQHTKQQCIDKSTGHTFEILPYGYYELDEEKSVFDSLGIESTNDPFLAAKWCEWDVVSQRLFPQ